jgi:hypothetical protein
MEESPMTVPRWLSTVSVFAILALAEPGQAQIAVSVNDNKVQLVNGVSQVVANPAPDTLTLFDLRRRLPRFMVEKDVQVFSWEARRFARRGGSR